MYRVELKDGNAAKTRLPKRVFLMYRVELKEHWAGMIPAPQQSEFLMYRVELKDCMPIPVSSIATLVPNVPCGVERMENLPYLHVFSLRS